MNDFFTQLAARSAGAAAVIRPRVPARFEPPGRTPEAAPLSAMADKERRGAPLDDASGQDEDASQAAEHPAIPAATALRQGARTSGRSADGEASHPVIAAAGPARPQQDPPEDPRGPIQAAPGADEALDPARSDSAAAAAPPAGADPVALRLGQNRAGAPAQRGAANDVNSAAVALQPAAHAGTPSLLMARTPTPAPQGASARLGEDQIARLVRALVGIPPEQRAGQPRERARQAPPRESAAPVIQVTIGRIEVRANGQSAAPPRERAAAASLTLAEYLRQQRSGT